MNSVCIVVAAVDAASVVPTNTRVNVHVHEGGRARAFLSHTLFLPPSLPPSLLPSPPPSVYILRERGNDARTGLFAYITNVRLQKASDNERSNT